MATHECPTRPGRAFRSLPYPPAPAPGAGGRSPVALGPAGNGHPADPVGAGRHCGEQAGTDRPGLAQKRGGRRQPAGAYGSAAQGPGRWPGRAALYRHGGPAGLQFCSTTEHRADEPTDRRRAPTPGPQPAAATHAHARPPGPDRQPGAAAARATLYHPDRRRRHRQDHRRLARGGIVDRTLPRRYSPVGPGASQCTVDDPAQSRRAARPHPH